jgi:NAD(P)-dependent dehydrogenase (short-subunit alcohol dehydrogenase family)
MDIEATAAIVTGGASGLGRATAERLVAAGAHVTIPGSGLSGQAALALPS